MARLRDGYSEFVARNAEILTLGPGNADTFRRYWENEHIPFVGLLDLGHRVAHIYKQEVNLFKLGRMPLICVVDRKGFVRYVHYGVSMRDIPSIEEHLHVIDVLNASSE